jgi:hypothetical protein
MDFEKFFQCLSPEKQTEILVVLDYVCNYRSGDRVSHKLIEMNLWNQLNELSKLGVINRTEGCHKDFKYEILSINEEITEFIKDYVEKHLYSNFAERETMKRIIRELIAGNFRSALKLFEEIVQYEYVTTFTLSSEHSYDPETRDFGCLLSRQGLGYFIGYRTVKAGNYYDEFIFREKPIDFKVLFLEVMKDETRIKLSSLSKEEKWCMFLRYINPSAGTEFFLANKSKFLPEEIRNAIKKIPEIKSKAFIDVFEPVLNEMRSKFSMTLRNLLLRDISSLWKFSLLLALGDTQGNMYRIGSYKLDKLKEIDSIKLSETMEYIDVFYREGIILKDHNDLIIPMVAKEIFESETKGNIVESKIFSDKLDAETFICDLVARAEKKLKIWDPYVTKSTLQLVSEGIGSKKLEVRILTSTPTVLKDLPHFYKKGIEPQVKVVYKKTDGKFGSPFHDRYLIIDDMRVWHFGPSLHGAGIKDAEMVEQLKREWGEKILELFEYNWETEKEKWEAKSWQVREFKVN